MIRTAFALVRTSLPSVLLLSCALIALATIMSDDAADVSADDAGTIPSLAVIPKRQPFDGRGAAALQSALFDPGRRTETVSGSIDDLRPDAPAAAPPPVTIAGVMLAGGAKRAMLSLGGATPAWSAVGAEVGGWRVAAIDADGAVVERDGQSITLKVADRYKLRGKPQVDAGAPSPTEGEAGSPPQPPPDPPDGPPAGQ